MHLTDSQWSKVTLPIRYGGLGIRQVSAPTFPAFLPSAVKTQRLRSSMLLKVDLTTDPHEVHAHPIELCEPNSRPNIRLTHKSGHLGYSLILREASDLFQSNQTQYHQARLRALSAEHTSDWLQALSIASCGLSKSG